MYNLFSIIFFICSLFAIQNDFEKFMCLIIVSGIFAIAGAIGSISSSIDKLIQGKFIFNYETQERVGTKTKAKLSIKKEVENQTQENN